MKKCVSAISQEQLFIILFWFLFANVFSDEVVYIENIENIYCHSLSIQYKYFVYRMYTKSISISKRLYIKTRGPNCKLPKQNFSSDLQ